MGGILKMHASHYNQLLSEKRAIFQIHGLGKKNKNKNKHELQFIHALSPDEFLSFRKPLLSSGQLCLQLMTLPLTISHHLHQLQVQYVVTISETFLGEDLTI